MTTDTEAALKINKGLDGVVESNSNIGFIDGQKGVLIYCGYNLHDLVPACSFEEVAYLLFWGVLPKRAELEAFKQQLLPFYAVPKVIYEILNNAPKHAVPMAVLRTCISAMAMDDASSDDVSVEAVRQKGMRLLVAASVITTAFDRIRKGLPVIEADPQLDLAANFLYMLSGERPSEVFARALDVYFILLAEHSFNASTFTARCVVSTLSDVYSAITAAIGSLKGPLHGGANEGAMKMLEEIGSMDHVEAYLTKAFSEKKKIMGFGHRVYKTDDPRATHLREMARQMSLENKPMADWFAMQQKIEAIMLKEKNIKPNVDFYSATVLHTLKIDETLFTPLFALARTTGWTAHILEQLSDNRLIRPLANYTGAMNLPVPRIQDR